MQGLQLSNGQCQPISSKFLVVHILENIFWHFCSSYFYYNLRSLLYAYISHFLPVICEETVYG